MANGCESIQQSYFKVKNAAISQSEASLREPIRVAYEPGFLRILAFTLVSSYLLPVDAAL
jgi:hypothetical protein